MGRSDWREHYVFEQFVREAREAGRAGGAFDGREADRRRPFVRRPRRDGPLARLRPGAQGRGDGRSALLRPAESPAALAAPASRARARPAFARRRRRALPPDAAAALRQPLHPRPHRARSAREAVDEHGKPGFALSFDPHFWEKFTRIDPVPIVSAAHCPLALIRGAKSQLFKPDDADYLMSLIAAGLAACRDPRGRAPRDDRPAAGVRRGAAGAAGGVALTPSPSPELSREGEGRG